MNRPDDYAALGRQHGQELAALRQRMLGCGYDADQWAEWMTHRLRAMADDLRAVGSSEDQVQQWALAVLCTYENASIAVQAEAAAYAAFVRAPVQGRA